MTALVANIPNYVLLKDQARIGPRLAKQTTGPQYSAFYAFSNPEKYNAYRERAAEESMPYPLVDAYLLSVIDIRDNVLRLVVIDPADSEAATLRAATVNDVFDARSAAENRVQLTYELTFDDLADGYRIHPAGAVPTRAASAKGQLEARASHGAHKDGQGVS